MDPLALAGLPAPLPALYARYQRAALADAEAARRYTRADAAVRRARGRVRAGAQPHAALRAAERARDAAWDAWALQDAAASRAWWAWESAFSAWDAAQAAGSPTLLLPGPRPALTATVAHTAGQEPAEGVALSWIA